MNDTGLRFNPARLTEARGDMGYTGLAAAVGVTEQTVRNWEAGKSQPDADRLAAIATATGKPIAYFFEAA